MIVQSLWHTFFSLNMITLMQDQAVITLGLRDVCLHAPKGRYVVTYDGDGEIDFAMDAVPVAFQKGWSFCTLNRWMRDSM